MSAIRDDEDNRSVADSSIYGGGVSVQDVIRSLLNSLLVVGTGIGLLVVSVASFAVFYYYNVPAHRVTSPIHLQFDAAGRYGPVSEVDLPFSPSELVVGQPYDISIDLHLPDAPSNHDIGNFMIHIDLFAGRAQPVSRSPTSEAADSIWRRSRVDSIASSSRPAIMHYTSSTIGALSTGLRAGMFVSGMRKETQSLTVSLLERYEFEAGWLSSPHYARVALSSPSLKVYSCTLRFDSQLFGIAWWLYNQRLLSFFVFSATFWLSSMTFAMSSWGIIVFVRSRTQRAHALDRRRRRKGKGRRSSSSSSKRHRTGAGSGVGAGSGFGGSGGGGSGSRSTESTFFKSSPRPGVSRQDSGASSGSTASSMKRDFDAPAPLTSTGSTTSSWPRNALGSGMVRQRSHRSDAAVPSDLDRRTGNASAVKDEPPESSASGSTASSEGSGEDLGASDSGGGGGPAGASSSFFRFDDNLRARENLERRTSGARLVAARTGGGANIKREPDY